MTDAAFLLCVLSFVAGYFLGMAVYAAAFRKTYNLALDIIQKAKQ